MSGRSNAFGRIAARIRDYLQPRFQRRLRQLTGQTAKRATRPAVTAFVDGDQDISEQTLKLFFALAVVDDGLAG